MQNENFVAVSALEKKFRFTNRAQKGQKGFIVEKYWCEYQCYWASASHTA